MTPSTVILIIFGIVFYGFVVYTGMSASWESRPDESNLGRDVSDEEVNKWLYRRYIASVLWPVVVVGMVVASPWWVYKGLRYVILMAWKGKA